MRAYCEAALEDISFSGPVKESAVAIDAAVERLTEQRQWSR